MLIDSSDGHIAFLALSDVPGKGDTLVAVPFDILSRSGENVFTLNTTQSKLAATPIFKESDMSNLKWAEDVYRFFGQQPYWTEFGYKGTGQMMNQSIGVKEPGPELFYGF